MAITNRINALLAERGISKSQFYKDLSISSASFSQWNRGAAKLRPERLEQIARYLGVSVEEITSDNEKTATQEDSGLDEREEKFLRLYRNDHRFHDMVEALAAAYENAAPNE